MKIDDDWTQRNSSSMGHRLNSISLREGRVFSHTSRIQNVRYRLKNSSRNIEITDLSLRLET